MAVDIKPSPRDASLQDTVRRVAEAAPDAPIKVRIQPQILVPGSGYRLWRAVSWVLLCDTPQEIDELRELIDESFKAALRLGTPEVTRRLRSMKGQALDTAEVDQ